MIYPIDFVMINQIQSHENTSRAKRKGGEGGRNNKGIVGDLLVSENGRETCIEILGEEGEAIFTASFAMNYCNDGSHLNVSSLHQYLYHQVAYNLR